MIKERKKSKPATNTSIANTYYVGFILSQHMAFSIILIVLFCITQTSNLFGQSSNTNYKTYNLAQEEENVIQNATHLEDFFENLFLQKTFNNRKINIVHIGDSHIQADYLTNIVRRNFQEQFGNAGRGLIVPGRVAGTNEPFNILTRSSRKWNAKRCVYPDQLLPIGIGGITINTNQPNSRLEIYMNDLWLDYSFNSITLFFKKDISSFSFSVKDTTNKTLAFINSFTNDPHVNYSSVLLPRTEGAFIIETIKETPEQNQATIFGLNLENGKNGILYHSVGVNGAKYIHYNAAMFFTEQTAALFPELFIISLGTNEAINFPYVDKNFFQQVDKMITSLKANNPFAKFILVTPPDSYRKKIKQNPGVQIIRNQIIQYAVENGLAFYDMYKSLGGENSAASWRASGLLRPDGVHFTKEGYEYQGNLFFNAIMKSYNQYVPLRHP